MRINNSRGPNLGGPDGLGGSTPTGSIGRFSGHMAPPGNSRLPAESLSPRPPHDPAKGHPPLCAAIIESASVETATIQEMESVHDWLLGSDANIGNYVDGVLMSSMLKDIFGRT